MSDISSCIHIWIRDKHSKNHEQSYQNRKYSKGMLSDKADSDSNYGSDSRLSYE